MQVPLPQNAGDANAHGPGTHSAIPQGKGLDPDPGSVPAHIQVPSLPLPATQISL